MRRIRGTRATDFMGGALQPITGEMQITRRNAQAIARTGVNHVANAAREQVWNENQDIIQCMYWAATLDGRTTAICRGNDGHGVPMPGKKLPKGIKLLKPSDLRPPCHRNNLV